MKTPTRSRKASKSESEGNRALYVAGRHLVARFAEREGVFQSGQMGQTVNLLLFSFGGSNPSAPTHFAEVAKSGRFVQDE